MRTNEADSFPFAPFFLVISIVFTCNNGFGNVAHG